MSYLAIRASGAINAVSRLHGAVSRDIFADLFPRWPLVEVPVGHVTNGVRTPTRDSLYAQRLWRVACRREHPWSGTLEGIADQTRAVSDDLLWGLRTRNRKELVQYVCERLEHQDAVAGGSDDNTQGSRTRFDPDKLTPRLHAPLCNLQTSNALAPAP
jgi:glycogen phosphorylase